MPEAACLSIFTSGFSVEPILQHPFFSISFFRKRWDRKAFRYKKETIVFRLLADYWIVQTSGR
jgi:hypothetical protein